MATVFNPILPGFHPDPSIVRVGDVYYIATSTFEWYPGVCIYRSTDLVNWQLAARPLADLTMLDMRGNPDSCGVWAPCLTYHNDRFYLAFTNTRRFAGDFKDTPNFITSAETVEGPWTAPIHVNSNGFDPSVFHDTSGKSYWLNMVWNHRSVSGRNNFLPHRFFCGIQCQEIDLSRGKLIGESKMIFEGSPIGLSEGPHITKRGECYYLMVAEGGTGKDHTVTVARSKSVWGPYEVAPNTPLVSSAAEPHSMLKRAGHGDWVDSPQGETYLVHLCSRPLPYRGRSVMGRETALQKVLWSEDGWPYLASGGRSPASVLDLEADFLPSLINEHVQFSTQELPDTYHSLRYPLPEEICYVDDGYLVLHGQESLGSWFEQSLLARRQQSFCYSYTVDLAFTPTHFQQMAGLTCYYNSIKYYYLHVTHDEDLGRVLDVSMCAGNWHSQYPMDKPIVLPHTGVVSLKAEVNYDLLTLHYKVEGASWIKLPMCLDFSVLSDELGDGGADANFTGSFVGICCQDLSGHKHPARFSALHYQEFSEDEV